MRGRGRFTSLAVVAAVVTLGVAAEALRADWLVMLMDGFFAQ